MSRSKAGTIVLLTLFPMLCFGSPKANSVSVGQAEVTSVGLNTTVKTSHQAILNWDSFSIGTGEKVEFVQPHSHSTVINRVQRGVTLIDGQLLANGRVCILNPNGVLIGKNGIISCAAFLATTLDFDGLQRLGDQGILFKGDSAAPIINFGRIEALSGDVILLAKMVTNEGVIQAPEGVVAIAAASEVLLKPDGVERLYISMSHDDTAVENRGVIEAARAELKADGNVYRLAINQAGVVEATGIAEENGRIVLRSEQGRIESSGNLCADSGTIHLLGEEVKVAEGALLDVSGVSGGGEILIGGDYQGANPEIPNAKQVIFERSATANASATECGSGGRVILWGDESTAFFGTIEARGGEQKGDGGFVEVSSPHSLVYKGVADLRPFNGEFGTLLLDPSEIEFSTSVSSGIEFQAGTFFPTSGVANLDLGDLTSALNMGNVTVTTQSNFAGSGDIIISNQFLWTPATTLTLLCDRDLNLNFTGMIEGPGGGSLIVDCGRNFNMTNGGQLKMLNGGAISITARTGSCNIASTSSQQAIITATGNISIDAKGGLSLTGTQPGGQLAEIITANGSILINQSPGFEESGDIIIGASSTTNVGIVTNVGTLAIRTGRDLKIFGPTQGPASTLVASNMGMTTIDVGRDLIVEAGDAGQGAQLLSITGDMNIRVGRDIQVTGAGAPAIIGYTRSTGMEVATGRLHINEVGGSVTVKGGPGTQGVAVIGAIPFSDDSWDFTGDIWLRNVRGGVTLDGSIGGAIIGCEAGGNTSFSGRIEVGAEKDIILTSGKGPAIIGANMTPFIGSTADVLVSGIQVKGENITLTGGESQFAAIGYTTTFESVNSNANFGVIDVEAQGALSLIPGTDVGPGPGTALIGVSALEGNANARIRMAGDTVTLNGSSGPISGRTQVVSSSGTTDVPRSILIEATNLAVGVNGSNSGSAEILASRDLLAIAKDNVTLQQSSRVEADGDLTLVADFQGLDSLEIGDGHFEMDSGAQLNSGGPLRIFTSKREDTVIGAPLNGQAFIPGPLFVDTDQEQWGSAFPKDFGGIPFTLFYKSGLDPLWPTKATQIFAEMFANLATYDQLLFDAKCFLFGYNKACYDQLFHPKEMVSSFDLFSEGTEYMLRQKYRNNRLKYVESF